MSKPPTIQNDDMTKYARDLGEYLMKIKLKLHHILDNIDTCQGNKTMINKSLEEINHVENELKAWP